MRASLADRAESEAPATSLRLSAGVIRDVDWSMLLVAVVSFEICLLCGLLGLLCSSSPIHDPCMKAKSSKPSKTRIACRGCVLRGVVSISEYRDILQFAKSGDPYFAFSPALLLRCSSHYLFSASSHSQPCQHRHANDEQVAPSRAKILLRSCPFGVVIASGCLRT